MSDIKTYLNFHSSCVVVKGASRAAIYDLQRSQVDLIPLDMYNVIKELEGVDIETLKKEVGKNNEDVVSEYINYLVEKEFCFFSTEEERGWFPPLRLDYETASVIDSVIIDVDSSSSHNWQNIFSKVKMVRCSDLQIRFFNQASISDLDGIIALVRHSSIKNIELLLPFVEDILEADIIAFLDSESRLGRIVFHSNKEDKLMKSEFGKPLIYLSEKINSNTHCGIIDTAFFSINIPTFAESQQFNTCLNKKISIDVLGNIKNCPSMSKSYGHISTTSFKDVIENADFQRLWNIHKNQVGVCNDCEFRHICTDCRAYLQDTDDIYSKPLKCGYDPYTGKWEEWSTNPLNKKAIEHYGMQELVACNK
jgi:SPASM domain peptide maturase of grasp-with-spasm system